jgi:hypothetical protein
MWDSMSQRFSGAKSRREVCETFWLLSAMRRERKRILSEGNSLHLSNARGWNPPRYAYEGLRPSLQNKKTALRIGGGQSGTQFSTKLIQVRQSYP